MKNTKKMFAICVSVMLALASMTACGSSSKFASNQEETSIVKARTLKKDSDCQPQIIEVDVVSDSKEKETDYWLPHSIELNREEQEYIDAVKTRLEDDQFYSEEEIEWLEEHDYSIDANGYSLKSGDGDELSYAIPYSNSEGKIYSWKCVGYHGDLIKEKVPSSSGVCISVNLHVESLGGEYCIIADSADSSLVYCPYTGEVKRFRFGDELDSAIVGSGTMLEYAGYDRFANEAIFLTSDNEIWSLNEETMRSRFLNKGISQIITTDYFYNSDMAHEILVIMTDGSIKVVLAHNGQLEEPHFVDGQIR